MILGGQYLVFLLHQGTERPHQGNLNTRDAIPNTTKEVSYQIRLVIWRQMWGETRGRCDGLLDGKFLARHEEQVSKIRIFPWFSRNEQVSKFGFFRGFLQFLRGGPTQKFPKLGLFRGFSGFWRMGLPKTFQNLDFSAVFLGFWRDGPNQKISDPANLSAVFLEIWRDGPTQKLSKPMNFTGLQANLQSSLDHKPGNREVWNELTNCFSSLPLHPLETSAF